ncbi:outer mitochondrial transmembrane helix translocase-like [Haliotis rubra]|uniref:outer mitochondrial transmembrane helix translocase-like n=1 Tax=Haliotis rubra TaxID=36100 RepID=UPI001EE6313B|nr:outer mitochondrial transmembrane helix translocase-like [Haliotis rubra]
MDTSWIKELKRDFSGIVQKYTSGLTFDDIVKEQQSQTMPGPLHEASRTITRQELLSKIISTLVGLAASFTITYFGVKYLVNAMDPTRKDKKEAQDRAQKMLKRLGVENVQKLSEYELCIASNLVDPLSIDISWEDIGGLDSLVKDIKETVILPFTHSDLFRNSQLLQPPKGVLLYGPPGCGKTMLAKATAKAAGARFLNLQISSLVDKWYGESQKRAEAVFSLAIKLQPTIIFIDEIDSFLRSRSSTDHEATVMIKTQFMSFWDGLITDPNCHVMVMGATNRPQDVDAAILRRMPSMFKIGLPIKSARKQILKLILEKEHASDIDYDRLADMTSEFSGSDLREVCRSAAITTVQELVIQRNNNTVHTGEEDLVNRRRITFSDLDNAIRKVRQTKSMPSFSQTIFPVD